MSTIPDNSTAKPATAARIYDYLLGGVHNFPADRDVAEKLIAGMPHARDVARANRAFLGRAVRYLASVGVDQYIDIGAGIPTQGNVHEILADVRPQARVVYVDIDQLAVAESMDLLAGNDRATAVRGDLRDPGPILAHSEVRRLLDLDQPVALLLVAVLHFVPDDAVAHNAVELLHRAVAPGSYLVASHGASERTPSEAEYSTIERAYDQRTMTGSAKPRNRAEFARFFDGWELVDPGVAWLSEWHPTSADATDPTLSGGWAAVARKP